MVYRVRICNRTGPNVRLLLFCLSLLPLSPELTAAPPRQTESRGWIGAEACRDCHAAQFEAWRGSHHDLAMQLASPESVLGDFDGARFEYAGKTTVFSRKGEEYWVRTEGRDGRLEDFRVEYTFGVYPLQQYLLALPGGRLQALSIAWDSRARQDGGQRWFHLYPDAAVDASDPLHWTGAYQNWNARCAECHSTNLRKNFDRETAEYSTTWSEIDVSCEACHGPGGLHRRLAEDGSLEERPGAGLSVDLSAPGRWQFEEGEAIARRQPRAGASRPERRTQQIESCGRCHSRRGALGDYRYGVDLLGTHRPSLLEEPLYHPDGQIRDEVYVYGSFLQSRMYRAGVVCGDCHEPHGLELRAPGNGVCAQCHRADVYDTAGHHRHAPGSEGALCAGCHMPETTYMVVDPRRDHGMRIPRPDLSVVLGTPNACTRCHAGKSARWALDSLRDWGIDFTDTGTHPARAFRRARLGDARAVPGLERLAMDTSSPAIWRASAAAQLGGFADREAYDVGRRLLRSPDPMLRMSAVRALEFLPPRQLLQVLRPHLGDSSQAVRTEMARALAPLSPERADPALADALRRLFDEYLHILSRHAGMPETQIQLGTFFAARQSWEAAEKAYRRALRIDPRALPALLNLADLYRVLEREEEARPLLLEAARVAPEQGAPLHALGLLESRAGNAERALSYLSRAADMEREGIRYRYVYAIALHDGGRSDEAIDRLKALLRVAPRNPDLLLALTTYCRDAGRTEEARRYAARLRELVPNDAGVQRLYDGL